ncbi:hypothetical protein [Dyella sp. C9]|uniref:hypothetical protein n=1 Tax=Dyella sp. C9 TaxID=2202154 RepID=UPI0013003D98|nr:hypothetical protein [Dyella sp. C9]
MRFASFGFGVGLLLAATASHSLATDHAANGNEATISVCELLKDGGPAKAIRIRIKAHYITDLRHAAFLDDPGCKGLVIQEDPRMSDSVDPSVARFDEATHEHMISHRLVEFDVDIEGIYTPRHAGEFWGNEAKGQLMIERVWSFQRTSSTP